MRSIVEDVLRDVTNIMRAEVRLARTEVKDDLRATGRAASMFGAAAICGLLAAACLAACVIAAISLALPVWLASLITACILACAGGALYRNGRGRMRQATPLEETRHRMRSDYRWVKQQIR